MLKALRTRLSQGRQYIADVSTAVPKGFRGLPVISTTPCEAGCHACSDACPTEAIALDPVRIDLGRCVFCEDCVAHCPPQKISFSPNPKMAATDRDRLVIREGDLGLSPVEVDLKVKALFGRSLKLRSVSAGGCNACELELNALSNVNFDIGRWGIDFVASPRHADVLVLSGPVTVNMMKSLELAFEAMPTPKFIVAVGACAISGGVFEHAPGVNRAFLEKFRPALYIPGCPPHPLTFLDGLLRLLGIIGDEQRLAENREAILEAHRQETLYWGLKRADEAVKYLGCSPKADARTTHGSDDER